MILIDGQCNTFYSFDLPDEFESNHEISKLTIVYIQHAVHFFFEILYDFLEDGDKNSNCVLHC